MNETSPDATSATRARDREATRAASHRRACACALALAARGCLLGLVGCVAQIRETRVYGEARPLPAAEPTSFVERHVAPGGGQDCRMVSRGAATMREVTIRRSFVGDAQERNFAMAALLGGGVGVIAYGQDKVNCPEQGGGCSVPTTAAWSVLGLAAVPLAFIVYNAIAVQDSHALEVDAPAPSAGPWAPCGAGPSAAADSGPQDGARVHEHAAELLQTVEQTR